MLARIKHWQKSSSFIAFKQLLLGNIAVQALNVCFYPIITRIYPSETLGSFGVQMNICYLAAIIFNGQYYYASVQEKDDKKVDDCVSISIALSLFFFLLTFIASFIFNFPTVLTFLTLFYSFTEIMKVWSYRLGRYKEASTSIFVNRLVSQFSKVLGYLSPSTFILLFSETLGNLAGLINYYRSGYSMKFKDIYDNMKLHKRFPLFFMPNSAIGYLLQEFPTFYFSKKFGLDVAAYFFLFQKILILPTSLVGSMFASSLIKKTVTFESLIESRMFLRNTILKIISASILPSLIIYLFGEPLFTIFLGENYSETGRIASMLFFLIPFKFLKGLGMISTLNSSRLGQLTTIKAIHLLMVLGLVLFFPSIDFKNFLLAFSLIEIAFDLINLSIALKK